MDISKCDKCHYKAKNIDIPICRLATIPCERLAKCPNEETLGWAQIFTDRKE